MQRLQLFGADVIIHCAFNRSRDASASSMYGYVNDNVLLTAALAAVPHEKFIYLSSIEVYPKNGALHSETEPIGMDAVNGLYGAAKLMERGRSRAVELKSSHTKGRRTAWRIFKEEYRNKTA